MVAAIDAAQLDRQMLQERLTDSIMEQAVRSDIADTDLQIKIEAEASTRTTSINAEIAARAAADTALQTNIDAELSRVLERPPPKVLYKQI